LKHKDTQGAWVRVSLVQCPGGHAMRRYISADDDVTVDDGSVTVDDDYVMVDVGDVM